MAIPGQRFELDLDADDFAFNPIDESLLGDAFRIRDIREHESSDVPAPPAPKPSKSGFPEHKQRKNVSRFKQMQNTAPAAEAVPSRRPPSDAAIAHRAAQRQDTAITSSQKDEISKENDRRIAAMSEAEIEEARAEIMATLSPGLVERLMKKSRTHKDQTSASSISTATKANTMAAEPQQQPPAKQVTLVDQDEENDEAIPTTLDNADHNLPSTQQQPTTPSVHFPIPPRSPSAYRPLDPSSATFLSDLKSTYFPELAHEPSPTSLSWLQPQTPQDLEASSYSPALSSYPASSIRFDFRGALIPPNQSLDLPSHLGLHHHGEAPDSAGYTIPELTTLSRSSLPNQRCVAYQTVGRILYRLGKEEFGARGTELYEALWAEVEKERVLEVIMAEANRERGHASAKSHATEALWLWRKGCGGERGLRKVGEKVAK